MLTLVLGGTRSGKSAVAERLAGACGPQVSYIATALVEPGDDDFVTRVAAHRARRPAEWSTIEGFDDLAAVVALAEGPALIDSLGTWVARQADFAVDGDALAAALAARAASTIVVSEEVGMGVHPATEVGRRFADALGMLNGSVAAVADEVLLVVAGRVLRLDPWLEPGPR